MCLEAAGRAWRLLLSLLQTCSISECEEAGEQGTATQGDSQPIPNTNGVTAQLPQRGPTTNVLTVVLK